MKIGFIVISAGEPKHFVDDLKKQVNALDIKGLTFYEIKNKRGEEGYSHGVNKGIRKALKDKKDLFIIANPDISLGQMTKEDLLGASSEFDVWGFSFKQDGKVYYGGELDKWRLSASLTTQKPEGRFAEYPFASGSLICIKKSVVDKIGLWDESYFLYYDEVDYCMRAKREGFKIGADSQVQYTHFELSNQNNPRKDYYIARSRFMFFMKYSNWKQKVYELARLPKTLTEERPFVLNFLTLNFSSFINKLLNFVLFIFLIRYLSVHDYGWYTLAWATVGLLQPFLDFGTTSYGLVHVGKNEERKLNSLFSLRVFLGLIVFISTLVLAKVLGYSGELYIYILLTSFTLFSNVFSGSLLIFASVSQKLLLPSILSIVFNTALIGTLIASLIGHHSITSIFIIIFLFYNLYTVINFYFLNREVGKLRLVIDFKEWIRILKKSTTFLLISLFAGLYFKLDVFLLNFLKGAREVGIYSSGYKFLEAFMFIAASYNMVSTPFMSKLSRKNKFVELKTKIKRDLKHMVPLGLALSAIVFALSPYLLTFIFRKDYSQAIPVLRIVIFALPFIFTTSIFFNALYSLGKEKVVVYLFIFQTVLNVALNLIFIPQYSYIASSYITIIGEIINTTVSHIFLQLALRNENIA